ncbi:MAG: hypothetical protein SF182_18345 [Deltaproteobacteria bacterium]|nr:hypothetical protein [Deltaproteobacteria bacterium]
MGLRRILAGAALLALALRPAAAAAAEATIDTFSSATAQTQFVPNANVLQATVGSTTRTDGPFADVIGNIRQLTVGATALGIIDYVVSGIVLPPVPFFEYNSTAEADGYAQVFYDRNGSGLYSYLAFAQGIQVVILEADLAAVAMPGLDVTVTLVDANMNSGQYTINVSMPVSPMAPLALQFPFANFAGVDPGNLFSIRIAIDPQVAGDLRLQTATTYGTPLEETICDDGIDNNNNGFIDCRDQNCVASPDCRTQAPAMSPLGLLAALLLVSGVAAVALRRRYT